jgi:hypothetical protein
MKRFAKALLLAGALATATAVFARSTIPVAEREISWTAGDGKSVDAETLRKAIISAGQKRQWDMVPSADGKSIKGSYSWNRNKHTIVLDIRPSATGYSFKYLDSVNMKYEVENGVPYIHPHYNRFVDQLIESVRAELSRF